MSQTIKTPAKRKKLTFVNYVDVFVSAGAGVVIFAAWAKLTHQPFANKMLAVGMWTETVIFLVYAVLEYMHPSRKNPEDMMSNFDEEGGGRVAIAAAPPSPLKSMEKMLEEADITPTNMKRLGENFQKLGTTVSQLGEVGDVVKSTGDFSAKTKEANNALGMMKDAFMNSANTMSSFNTAADSARNFKDQIQVLTKNLGSLNTIYELELNESNNHLKALNTFYGKMAKASEVMVSTVDDAQKTKDQINVLAVNLGKLNQVYGNMLTAMQLNK